MTSTLNSMRALAVGLALTVSIGALAGCGSDAPPTTTVMPQATTTTSERTSTTNP